MKTLIARLPVVIISLFFLNSCGKNEPVKVTQLPVAPTALKATVFSSTAINLSWTDNSGDEDGFKIERKNGAADFKLIATTGANKNVYKDSLLTPYTTYTYRVYAYNVAGQSKAYTNLDSATTIGVPVLTTATITGITSATAQGGGNITSDGGSAITARGVCWSTTASPTIANSKTTDSSGIGAFASILASLTAGTTYYVRSYATNNAGTAYGNEEHFTTADQGSVIYVAGGTTDLIAGQTAVVWKDDAATLLPGAAFAYSVYAVGNDVYTAGYTNGAIVWKNGVATRLGDSYSQALSVFVAGTDVYVAGSTYDLTSKNYFATVWKNGVPTPIGVGSAFSVYVVGADVYVAGRTFDTTSRKTYSTIWKNGVATYLESSTGSPYYAYSVFVVGTDVYAAGTTIDANMVTHAIVWKNGVETILGRGDATSVFVAGTDVYVAGTATHTTNPNYTPTLWKNGVATQLGNAGSAYSVYGVDNDVYVSGYTIDGSGNSIATVWKNGIATSLGSGSGRAVFVTPK